MSMCSLKKISVKTLLLTLLLRMLLLLLNSCMDTLFLNEHAQLKNETKFKK